jgi:putative chitinase
MITLELLKAIAPKTKQNVLEQYVGPLDEVAKYYDMYDNVHRAAGFVAQTAHESGGFNFIKENLNYSASGLVKTFPKYFTQETAEAYQHQPEKIASRIYANRMGNGDEASGDGYRFCGRGLIQLTGRSNYTKFSGDLGISVEDCVTYIETAEGATSSAGWFWDNNNLNQYCDSDDFVMLTKRINGGTIGIEERKRLYQIVLSTLQQ